MCERPIFLDAALLSLLPLPLGVVWTGAYVLLGHHDTFFFFILIWTTHLHLVTERSIRR